MNTEQIKKFREFNFIEDPKWQEYWSRLDPVPPMDRLLKLRKRWYKANIDKDFDVEADLEKAEAEASNAQQSQYRPAPAQPAETRAFSGHKLYHFEGLLKLAFFIISFVAQFVDRLHFVNLAIGVLTCALAVYRQHGAVQLSKEYAQAVISNEFGVGIFYLLALFTIQSRGPFIYLPIMAHFLIGVSEFALRTDYRLLKISKIAGFLEGVQMLKNDIKLAKAYFEFFNLFYFILLIALGKIGILFIIIYLNFIKMKFKTNPQTNYAVNGVKTWLTEKVRRVPGLGVLLAKAIAGIFWVVTF
jgi:hypothetical protein